ncbi:DUF3658 domain-containing protein, partial [Klebsiella pneumoniae]
VMPIAMIPPDILRQRYQERRLVSAGLQRQLASEWEDWRENGKGIRTLKNGVLTESAIDSVDPAILSLFSQGPLALRRGIGHAMAITGLTDALCHWRIKIL